jgi:hypothetical protein
MLTTLLLQVVNLVASRPTNDHIQDPVVLKCTTEDIPTEIQTTPEVIRTVVNNTDNVPLADTHTVNINKVNKKNKKSRKGKPKHDTPSDKDSSSDDSSSSSSSSTSSSDSSSSTTSTSTSSSSTSVRSSTSSSTTIRRMT